jgi:hypothetical protein
MELTINSIKKTPYGQSIMVYTQEGEKLPLFIKEHNGVNMWTKYKAADGIDLPDEAMKGHTIVLDDAVIVRKGDTWERDGESGTYEYDKIKSLGEITIKINPLAHLTYATNKRTVAKIDELIDTKLNDTLDKMLDDNLLDAIAAGIK